MHRRAFSLVELLVSIAIIAVLFAMLLPAVNKAKQSGKQAVCAANVHTWSLASITYATDNRTYFAPRAGSYSNIPQTAWFALMMPYVSASKSATLPYKVLFCPEGAVTPQYQSSFVNVNGGAMEYVVYAAMPSPVGGAAPRPPVRLDDTIDQFNRPKVILGDIARWSVRPTNPYDGSAIHSTHENLNKAHFNFPSVAVPGLVYSIGIPRGINVGYIDGSIRWNNWDRMDFTKFMLVGGDYSNLWDQPD